MTGDTMTLPLQADESFAIGDDMTMFDLDLLRARRFEIGTEVDKLTRHIEALEKEAQELEQAENVLLRLARHVGRELPPSSRDEIRARQEVLSEQALTAGKPEGIPTMPEMITMVLREHTDGLEPKEIAAIIGKRWWPRVPVNAVGPIAWRMHKRSQLAKSGALYQHLDFAKGSDQKGPEAGASEPLLNG